VKINKVHHIAIIASDYKKSKRFYVEVLGCSVVAEHYREERDSYKLDLAINGDYLIELFSFPAPPKRLSYPEACGLRHLAFAVEDIEVELQELKNKNVKTTELMVDEYTGKKMAFFFDPDELPLELYEV
jgi:glyoxylase I family protein